MNLSKTVVEKIVIASNTPRSGKRFEINPETVVKAIAESEKKFHFIGLFHSHPAPVTPSPVDMKFMKLWEDAIWLILSSTEDKIAAFQIKDSELQEVAIEVE
jgi:proteasome lid subunit RPN8/RPN11